MLTFAREAAAVLPMVEPIVEIGARPAQGQEELDTVRSLFADREFIACDYQSGAGVDRVEDVHALTFDSDSVGAVFSVDTLEHVADPIRAMQEIHRVLRPGGVAVITSVMFFPIHAHPFDYWRFTPEGFAQVLAPFETKLVIHQGWDLMPESVLGVGVKGPFDLHESMFPETTRVRDRWGDSYGTVDLGPIRMRLRDLWGLTARETIQNLKGRARVRR